MVLILDWDFNSTLIGKQQKNIAMKKNYISISIVHKIAFWAMLPLVLLTIYSCEEENSDELSVYDLVIPESAYSFTVSSVDTDDETTVYVEPSFTKNFETLGCSVKKVVYYIDNNLAATITQEPFKLEYTTSLLAKGQHVMKADFTVGGDRFKDTTVECKKEFSVSNSSSSSQSAIKFDIDYDHYLRVGDKLNVKLKMTDRYNAGYIINEVKYYFEDKLVSTKTSAPFDLEYSPTLTIGQSYSLKVQISYSLGSSSFSSYSFLATVSVLSDEETRYFFSPGFTNAPHFNNGDAITGTGLLYRGNGDELVYELNIYWDEQLVGTSRNFPYNFSYTIQNASRGIHHLKHEWKKFEKDGKTSIGGQSQTETITIDK